MKVLRNCSWARWSIEKERLNYIVTEIPDSSDGAHSSYLYARKMSNMVIRIVFGMVITYRVDIS
jgi:hypothetical protein